MNKNMSSEKMIMPIGKYKGQPIEAIQHDKKYFDWLCQQSWFREKYGDTYQIIINNFQEPTETPEHNKLQATFLQESFLTSFLKFMFSSPLKYKINISKNVRLLKACVKEYVKAKNEYKNNKCIFSQNWYEAKHNAMAIQMNIIRTKKYLDFIDDAEVVFEEKGWDVVILNDIGDECVKIGIEIKPTISDDYPAVLRQIKNQSIDGFKVLMYDVFSAKGASIEQMKQIFASSRVYVLSFADILGHEVL